MQPRSRNHEPTFVARFAAYACFVMLAAIAGCDSRPAPSSPQAAPAAERAAADRPAAERPIAADAEWYRSQLIDGIARPLLRNAVADNGFYRPFLGRDWRPLAEQRATLVSQSRAIYVLAAAYEVSGDAAYKDALVKLADFLLARFANPSTPGVWASAVSADGAVVDPGFYALAHAQAMFALAHAYRSTSDKRYLDAALATWITMDVPRLVDQKNPLFKATALPVSMHLFEALLALYRAAPSKLLLDDLSRMRDYIVANFFDRQKGFFYENLDASLRPPPTGTVVVAHNARIAFFLSRAVAAGLPEKYLDIANRTVDFVVRSVNPTNSSLPFEIDYNGKITNATIFGPNQADLILCLAHYASARGRTDLQRLHDDAVTYAKTHLVDPEFGGWYAEADRPDLPKGHDWKVSYHETLMFTEELRLRGWKFRSGAEMLL